MIDALTQKQENFCAAYVECGSGSESYRRAYSAARMKPETIANEASKLLQNPDITMRIDQLRSDAAQRHNLTVDSLLTELEEARKSALGLGLPQASIAATLGKAKLLGLDKPGTDLDIEAKRLAVEKLRMEVEALTEDAHDGDGTAPISVMIERRSARKQNFAPEYVLAPDGPIPDAPIL